ncbi:CTP synthase [Bifidobacterium miconisargentati]|uniref:CTP synthase n=1 Tax=Bifidobacterium miconisargentati TaxID=2834437 RepID=UPI001F2AEE23|nr:CTP synthase [Bifidobacterium miconisargentati]
MRHHIELEALCDDAERNHRCFYPTSNALQQATYVRLRNGYLVRPHRNVYCRASYWATLNPAERSRHIIRTLSRQFPTHVFAGLSAAAILQLEYSWHLHDDGSIFIASSTGSPKRTYQGIRRIGMTDPPVSSVIHFRRGDGIRAKAIPGPLTMNPRQTPSSQATLFGIACSDITDIIRITSPARTLVDCGLRYTFAQSLPMFDSALRNHLTTPQQVMDICDGMRTECGSIMRLLHYADPLSENGGESLCRAVVIEEGFAVPQLQHVFTDVDASWTRYRVDFVWHTEDGRIIVLEFDGTAKYTDPSMTRHSNVHTVVRAERDREDALRRAGVTTIIRTNYEEVTLRTPLVRKLLDARVPMTSMNPRYERATDVTGREL